MRLVRNWMPAFAPPPPSSFTFSRSSKSPYVFVVQRNSFRATLRSSEPPTMAPSWMRKIARSPSHPVKVFPSTSWTRCGCVWFRPGVWPAPAVRTSANISRNIGTPPAQRRRRSSPECDQHIRPGVRARGAAANRKRLIAVSCGAVMPNQFDSPDSSLFDIATHVAGPSGALPLTAEMLRERPSGDLFGWTQNAGMGWEPSAIGGREFLMLSTHGGIRAADGTPIALGYHTGHWEVGLLLEAAAAVFKGAGAIPFAAACTDPCDGRSQGTTAMFDSLPFRNDAATVFRRLIRSLPTRRGVLGVATCDKGLPAMMMALAAIHDLPVVLVPGGVTLMPEQGEDAGKVQTLGVRFVHGSITLEEAADLGCRACGSPGGGCQFLGTAATSQVVGEALGMSLGHSALAPSGHPIWLDMAARSAAALLGLEERGVRMRDILTDAALHNAMVTHAAFGGSTNLILHLPAIAHAAGLRRPTAPDWTAR